MYIIEIFHFAHRTLKRHVLKGLVLLKLVNVIAFSRTFFNGTFSPCENALAVKNPRLWYGLVEEHKTLVQFGATSLICAKDPTVLLSTVFVPFV